MSSMVAAMSRWLMPRAYIASTLPSMDETLVLLDDLRFKRTLAIPRDADRNLAQRGLERLG